MHDLRFESKNTYVRRTQAVVLAITGSILAMVLITAQTALDVVTSPLFTIYRAIKRLVEGTIYCAWYSRETLRRNWND